MKSRDRWANVGPFVVTIDPRWRKWRFTSLPAAGIEVFVGLIIELYVELWADINHVPGKIFLNKYSKYFAKHLIIQHKWGRKMP